MIWILWWACAAEKGGAGGESGGESGGDTDAMESDTPYCGAVQVDVGPEHEEEGWPAPLGEVLEALSVPVEVELVVEGDEGRAVGLVQLQLSADNSNMISGSPSGGGTCEYRYFGDGALILDFPHLIEASLPGQLSVYPESGRVKYDGAVGLGEARGSLIDGLEWPALEVDLSGEELAWEGEIWVSEELETYSSVAVATELLATFSPP